MVELATQLYEAARQGDLAQVSACLAAGADPNALVFDETQATEEEGSGHEVPLVVAAGAGHAAAVAALLAAGADPNGAGNQFARSLPLMTPAFLGSPQHAECVRLLLAAGADPAILPKGSYWTPMHAAAYGGHAAILRQMLLANPAGALVMAKGPAEACTPLRLALGMHAPHNPYRRPVCLAGARCLLDEGPRQPAGELVALLRERGNEALALYAVVVARQPLTPAEWALVPAPCPGLAALLPSVLERSGEEAALLVRCLPLAHRQRLRTAALCLASAQQCLITPSPSPLVRHILALSAAG